MEGQGNLSGSGKVRQCKMYQGAKVYRVAQTFLQSDKHLHLFTCIAYLAEILIMLLTSRSGDFLLQYFTTCHAFAELLLFYSYFASTN